MKSKYLIVAGVVAGVIFGTAIAAYASTHTLQFVETPIVQLYEAESYNATSITVTPVPIDLDGNVLTMSSFGSSPTLTVDAGISGYEEIEGFTSITNNGNGTATIGGLTRDLASQYPYTTSGTGKAHAAGSTVVFSNNPQMYARFAAPENTQTWTATQTFASTTYPGFDLDPGATYYTTGPNTTFVDYAQLIRTALAGTVNASPSTQGVLQIATPIQAASSTVFGSSGAYLALTSSIATSTCSVATSSVLTLQSNGHIYGPCLDQTFGYTLSGNSNFTGTTTFSGTNGGILDNAASSTFTGIVNLNGTILLNGVPLAHQFGGTGANGALSISSGTTTISLGNAAYYELDYTSVSITGTGNLTFSNPNTNGTFIVIRSQGNVTLSCTNQFCIDVAGMGGAGGANTSSTNHAATTGSNGNPFYLFGTNAGTSNGGAVSTALTPSSLYLTATSTLQKYGAQFWVGAGGAGGGLSGVGGTSGAGGAGGGGLLLEVGGALNLTATDAINASGINGSNAATCNSGNGTSYGGGGGAGGLIEVIYNTLTANSGTLVASAGTGGNNAASGCGTTGTAETGGGGGGTAYIAGSNGSNSSTNSATTGGAGGAGNTEIIQNTNFY